MIEAVDAAGFHMNVYVDDQLYVEELNEEAVTYADATPGSRRTPSATCSRGSTEPTTKIVVVGEPEALDRLQDELRARFDGRAFIAKSLPIFLELALSGRVARASALEFVCERLGIDPGTVVAFGDGANDVELLETAGPRRGGRRRRRRAAARSPTGRCRASTMTGSRASSTR